MAKPDISNPENLSHLDKLRHSAAHVLADAVKQLYPTAKLTIGPPTENGFYYDFDFERSFTPEDLTHIEAKMSEIIAEGHTFEMAHISRDEAKSLFSESNESYKIELLDAIPDGEDISICRHGNFVDLCRGGHVDTTKQLNAFKLTGVAGAYWRGSEQNAMLQRIYGTAFTDAKSLRLHLANLEEAKKRDHRKLGKQLDLFSFDDKVGPGLVLWHPKGALIRHMIEDYWRKEHFSRGYDLLYTPHIAREALWEQSGHLGFYKESMFSGLDVDGQQYLARPMNCPYHVTIFKNTLRSYRELPLRWAELGTVYRYERSGVLHGLFRVRGFTQDDAHLFVRPDQLEDEVQALIDFCKNMLSRFGFEDFELFFSTRPEKYVGDIEVWDNAEAVLKRCLEASGLPFEIDAGGGAFYGPKIDLKIKDSIGRQWQCSTIQVDFQLPERFDLKYVGQDGSRDHRPIMIHRAMLGSIERFFGILVEHYAGDFPLWLAPVQVRVLSLSEDQIEYAGEIVAKLHAAGIRAEPDTRKEKIGAKIREAEGAKIPYTLTVGGKEMEAKEVCPRKRKGKPEGSISIDAFIERIVAEAAA